MSACSRGATEEAFLYSFHAIDYGHTMGEEDGEVFTRDEIESAALNFSIVNLSGETLDIGNDIKIERLENGSWILVEPTENYAEETVLISIPHENAFEYTVSVEDRFLAEDE